VAADYSILLQSPGAVPLRDLDKVAACTYARANNAGGAMTLTLPDGVYDPSLFAPYSRIVVQRSLPGVPPYVDLDTPWFVVTGPIYSLSADGRALVSFGAVDALELILNGRNVAYNDYNEFTYKLAAADDMAKAVVRENAGSLATDTDRDLTGFMNVAPDVAAAPIIRMGSFARQQVLDVLGEIADASANDDTPTWLGFDVALADVVSGLLEFRTYINQRGNDHRFPGGNPPLLLSPEAGTLADVVTQTNYANVASYIYAGGAGVGDIRPIAAASSAALIALSPFGRRERFVDGSQIVDPDALQALADAQLQQARIAQTLTGRIVELPNTLRGVHWDYGDYTTANYRGATFDCRVDKIRVNLTAAPAGGLIEDTQALLAGETAVESA